MMDIHVLNPMKRFVEIKILFDLSFVKHELKRVLKYIGVKSPPPLDRYAPNPGSGAYLGPLDRFRVSHFNPARIVLTAFFIN
jgi:hypothetical protein